MRLRWVESLELHEVSLLLTLLHRKIGNTLVLIIIRLIPINMPHMLFNDTLVLTRDRYLWLLPHHIFLLDLRMISLIVALMLDNRGRISNALTIIHVIRDAASGIYLLLLFCFLLKF